MSFGLVNVPKIFQRYVNQILKKELDQENIIYINDIFIINKETIKHQKRIRQILKKL